MNDDNDLRALYLASQKDVHAPEQLKERQRCSLGLCRA